MTETTTQEQSNEIADLGEHNYGKSLFRDSMERLSRNRLAMIGAVIIVLNILVATFAGLLAPRHYATQILDDNNAAPAWVMPLFPVLEPKDEVWDIGEGQAVVEAGQEVKTKDLLISYSGQELTAPIESRVFVDVRRVNLFPPDADIPQFTLPADTTLAVEDGARVNPGDILFGDTTAPIQGTVLQVDDTVWIMPRTSWRSDLGEVLVETGQAVTAGDALFSTDNGDVVASVDGTIFMTRSSVEIWTFPIERLTIPEGAEVHIRATRSSKDVVAGEALFDDVTASMDGVALQVENEMLVFRNQSWEYGEGIPIVTTGDVLEAGELLIDFTPLNVHANMDGYVIIADGQVTLSAIEPVSYDIPEGASLSVISGQPIQSGQAILPGASADVTGTVYVGEDKVFVLPNHNGYVNVRNEYFLGADNLGRDILSRLIYGARISLAIAFIGPLVATVVGVSVGLLSGYKGGWIDNLIMRIVDVFYAFPTLLLIILMMAYFRSGAFSKPGAEGSIGFIMYNLDQSLGGMLFIFIGIGLTSWLGLARLTRGQVLAARENDYILAARAMGASQMQIVLKHILPNILGPLIVAETLTIPSYIRSEAFLSFIGLGVSAPTPSWGQMISDGAAAVGSYPFQAIFPALALFFIMFAFNFLGDGLRDAFDPRLRGQD